MLLELYCNSYKIQDILTEELNRSLCIQEAQRTSGLHLVVKLKPGSRDTAMLTGQDEKHHHSILGYSFHFGIGAVTWSSKKQHIIMLSSTKAEYIAQTHTAKEGIWLQRFIAKILGSEPTVIKVNCYNQGAIVLTKDNKFHSCTKHINLWYHFIWEDVEDNKSQSVVYQQMRMYQMYLQRLLVPSVFSKAQPIS